jgi:NADPH:quinone reductase-like Zn-dependent oxidoreductase
MPDRSMHALRVREKGGPEHLVYEVVPLPPVGIGDVGITVHAASFTHTELDWPSTWVDRAGKDRRPIIPAHEVSGVVAALGYGTTGFAVGDEVYGITDWYRDGAAAEHVAVEARNLAPKPATLTHVQAAAVSLAGLTAWQALHDHGGLTADQTVLIHGAGGGVGAWAIQLARAAGAHVWGTGRGHSRELVTELGADRFIDIDSESVEDIGRQVDLVVDLVGGDVLDRSWSVLKPGGTLVSIVDDPSIGARRGSNTRSVFFVVEPNRAQLVELARMIDAGTLRANVGAVFPLARGAEAFRAKQNSGVPGKVVLEVVPAQKDL